MLLNFFFPKIYGEKAGSEIEKVKSICQDLVKEYSMKIKGKEPLSSTSSSIPNVLEVDGGGDFHSDFAMYVNENSSVTNLKSELDHYLEEKVLPISSKEFDILGWWKANGLKYPILQMIARDFLAIPISTVASESSFSTGGRFLTPHRSRLRPDTLEALMCVQDWLWTHDKGSCGTMSEDYDENDEASDATGATGVTTS